MDDTPKYDPDVARIVRLEFERLACKLERVQTNEAYARVYKLAAKLVRESKPD